MIDDQMKPAERVFAGFAADEDDLDDLLSDIAEDVDQATEVDSLDEFFSQL